MQGEAPEWQRLYDRREDYRIGTVPKGGLFLTAGVDIQKDRIELEVVAWGARCMLEPPCRREIDVSTEFHQFRKAAV